MSLITVYVKTLSGEMMTVMTDPAQGLSGICRHLSEYDPNYSCVRLIRSSEEEDAVFSPLSDGEVLFLFVPERIYLLNQTTGTYVETTLDYHHTYRHLVRPLSPSMALLRGDVGMSHWNPHDNIVFVPDHLKTFVAAHYARIDP